jgi:hypothetical protein
MSSTAIAEAESKSDEVKPERVPKDTAAELERVKQLIGAHLGVDMRSPGQVAQAEEDGEKAEKELEAQQAKEAKEAQEAEQAEAKALAGASRSTK